ncbi:MAG TPA: DNA gyrase inhibitor YacG [Terriglobia bacterium]|nr:DNA gyrase inhibitor YacG [Terriglobia bacterium]
MKCPICRREFGDESRAFRPFCSERCKLIDLNNWLSGRYRISTPVTAEKESASPMTGMTNVSDPELEARSKADRD